MPRKVTSSWDFGELFPAKATRQVFSVSDLTLRIKNLLEQQLGLLWVSGEVTNLRAQSSGHLYFALKDAGAQLNCVLFRGTAVQDRASLKDGQRVTLQGDLTVYEPRGQHQLIVRAVELQGIGALQAAFERLKQKLLAEGLFEAARKRAIPRFPDRVGIVTSATGAALQDVLHVLARRYAGLDLVLVHSRVQGAGAELEIAAAIARLNTWSASHPDRRLDLILVTRGGGSLEELWAFNEEVVARAIAGSVIPIVSAVGHEIDITIADMVADLRAATPSAAAELLTAAFVASREWIEVAGARLRRHLDTELEARRDALEQLGARLQRAHPRRRLEERIQRIDELAVALGRRMLEGLTQSRRATAAAMARLAAVQPARRLEHARTGFARCHEEFAAGMRRSLERRGESLARLGLRLQLLSPLHTLARGYSITLDAGTGQVVREPSVAPEGTELLTRLASGELRSVVVHPSPGKTGPGRGT